MKPNPELQARYGPVITALCEQGHHATGNPADYACGGRARVNKAGNVPCVCDCHKRAVRADLGSSDVTLVG